MTDRVIESQVHSSLVGRASAVPVSLLNPEKILVSPDPLATTLHRHRVQNAAFDTPVTIDVPKWQFNKELFLLTELSASGAADYGAGVGAHLIERVEITSGSNTICNYEYLPVFMSWLNKQESAVQAAMVELMGGTVGATARDVITPIPTPWSGMFASATGNRSPLPIHRLKDLKIRLTIRPQDRVTQGASTAAITNMYLYGRNVQTSHAAMAKSAAKPYEEASVSWKTQTNLAAADATDDVVEDLTGFRGSISHVVTIPWDGSTYASPGNDFWTVGTLTNHLMRHDGEEIPGSRYLYRNLFLFMGLVDGDYRQSAVGGTSPALTSFGFHSDVAYKGFGGAIHSNHYKRLEAVYRADTGTATTNVVSWVAYIHALLFIKDGYLYLRE